MNENRIVVNGKDQEVHIVALKQGIDALSSTGVEQELISHLEKDHRHLLIDMTEVDHISSHGLRMLVSVWKRVHDLRGSMIIVGLRPPLREVMRLIGFDLVFPIFDSLDDALVRRKKE